MHGKRGETDILLWFGIIELTLLLITGIFLYGLTNSYIDNTAYWKHYYAKDVSYLAEVMHTDMGDLVFGYEQNYVDNPIQIELQEGRVDVSDIPKGKGDPVTNYFALSKDITIHPATVTTFFTLSKKGTGITLSSTPEQVADTCDYIDSFPVPFKINTGSVFSTAPSSIVQTHTTFERLLSVQGYTPDQSDLFFTYVPKLGTPDQKGIIIQANGERTLHSKELVCYLRHQLLQEDPTLPVTIEYIDEFRRGVPIVNVIIAPDILNQISPNRMAELMADALAQYGAT